MARKGLIDALYGCENVEETFLFCVSIQISSLMNFFYRVLFFFICSYFKGNTFTALKRNKKFQTRFVKGVQFINRRYTKRIPFLSKMVYKG